LIDKQYYSPHKTHRPRFCPTLIFESNIYGYFGYVEDFVRFNRKGYIYIYIYIYDYFCNIEYFVRELTNQHFEMDYLTYR